MREARGDGDKFFYGEVGDEWSLSTPLRAFTIRLRAPESCLSASAPRSWPFLPSEHRSPISFLNQDVTISSETPAINHGDLMRYASLAACCAPLFFPALALADPMPILPELPPLPTDYQSQGQGFYAGILAGYVDASDTGLGLGVVVGTTFSATDLLLGVEAMGLTTSYGESTIEGSLRAGVSLTEFVNVFASVGVGHSFRTDTYLSAGASLEADVGDGWVVRTDYRYNHDLSGDPESHRVLMGLLRSF